MRSARVWVSRVSSAHVGAFTQRNRALDPLVLST